MLCIKAFLCSGGRIASFCFSKRLADPLWVLNNEKKAFERTALVVFFMPCTFVRAQVRP